MTTKNHPITCICAGVRVGTYEHQVQMVNPFWKTRLIVCIDVCLATTVAELWHQGVETTNSCCGHGTMDASVCVTEASFPKMAELGWRQDVGQAFVWYPPTVPADEARAEVRHERQCAADVTGGAARCQCSAPPVPVVPAEPEVEALRGYSSTLHSLIHNGTNLSMGPARRIADEILAAGYLSLSQVRARERAAAAKALRDLADDLDPDGYGWTSVRNADRFRAKIRERADALGGDA